MSLIAEDELDDTLMSVMVHPITEQTGRLGNAGWHDAGKHKAPDLCAGHGDDSSAGGRSARLLDQKDPVPYLDGVVLDFGTARLPKRRARVGIWVTRGLTTPAAFEDFRQLVARRPADGLRVVLFIDLPDPGL